MKQVAICVSKLLSLSRHFQISFEEQFFILWLVMANVHYNRTTTLGRREKTIALWTSGSKQAQIAEGLSPQTVSNIVNKFLQRGTYFPGKPGWKAEGVICRLQVAGCRLQVAGCRSNIDNFNEYK